MIVYIPIPYSSHLSVRTALKRLLTAESLSSPKVLSYGTIN